MFLDNVCLGLFPQYLRQYIERSAWHNFKNVGENWNLVS